MSLAADGRSSRAEAKRQQRVLQIERIAARLFADNGFHTTSVADVIAAADISRGTFYLYFDSKEGLFLSLVDRFIRQIISVVRVVDPHGEYPTREIAENLRRVIDVVFDNPNLTRLVLQQSLGLNDEVDAKLQRLNGFLQEMVEGTLVNGARTGLIREVNAPLVAQVLIGGMKEVFCGLLSSDVTSAVDRATMAKELLEFGLFGLQTRT